LEEGESQFFEFTRDNANAADITPDYYQHFCRLRTMHPADTSDYDTLQLYANADANGDSEFNYKEIVEKIINDIALPSATQKYTDFALMLNTSFAESYGDPAVINKLLDAATIYVVPFILKGAALKAFINSSIYPFILVSAVDKTTHLLAIEYVCAVNPIDTTVTLTPRVICTMADGSTQELILTAKAEECLFLDMVCFNVSVSEFESQITGDKDLISYEVQVYIEYDDQEQAEHLNYKLGTSVYYEVEEAEIYDREFLFANNYNAWETIHATGMQTETLNLDRQQSISPAVLSTETNEFVKSQINLSHLSYECNFGFADETKMESIRQFLSSERIYLIDENEEFVQIDLLDNNIETDKEENLQNVKFKYRIAENYK
jgi:hypothetical protein